MKTKQTDESYEGLEFFTKKGGRFANAKITITERFSFLFSSGFCHMANLENKDYVRLAYYPKTSEIFFDFTEDKDAEGVFKLLHRGAPAFTTCQSFFKANYLNKDQVVGSYSPHKKRIPKIGEVWFIKLDEKVQ